MLAGCSNSEEHRGGCYTYTDYRKSNMFRLLHRCLIAAFMAASLMLLPLDCGEYVYDTTPSPDYDYNATFDYSFYSNSSSEDLETFFNRIENENGRNEELDISHTDPVSTATSPRNKNHEDRNEELDISHTDPVSTATSSRNKAFRTVYPSLLLTLILAIHQLLRFL